MGIGLFLPLTKNVSAHSIDSVRGMSRNIRMMRMGEMMRSEDRDEMINMMRQHHGDNWQEHCQNMMNEIEQQS